MPAADRTAVVARMQAWLVRANPELDAAAIGEETDIIETRILESLQLVEFILFIETESGRTILSEELDPNDLRTLATIYTRFFQVEK
jgi:acyl carrier protein